MAKTLRHFVWITTSFTAHHRWVNAPDEVAFLRDYHRHKFNVRLGVPVDHNDRAVEFFTLKKQVDAHIAGTYTDGYFSKSCEMIAAELAMFFDASFVTVDEDGENGGTVLVD